MGDVFLAEHKVLENIVAIKSLHPNLVKDEVFRKRFKSEAKIHSKLNHPNVVKLIDFQERKDGLFIIMEYVEGQQLDDYIKNVSGPINENELIPLFTQIVDAISHAHSKGLIHRDIKPANIIISKNKIKVLDFGIAKEISEESGLTKTGVQVGTPMYMSPEQVNADHIDNLTDIYSLGVTLFYMAVGNAPYENSNAMKMGIKIVTEPFPEAKKFYPAISKKIESIIEKATQKKKKDRYQSCEDFKNELNTFKKDKKIVKEGNKNKKWYKNKTLIPISLICLVAGLIIIIPIIKEVVIEEVVTQVPINHNPEYFTFPILAISEIKLGKAFDSNENLLGRIKDGKRDGEWKEYYDNNQVAIEGSYSNGLMNGYFKHYWKTGELRHEGKYENGDRKSISTVSGIPISGREGLHIFYYKNGNFQSKQNLKKGVIVGNLIEYHYNGLVKTEAKYNNYGNQIWEKKWDISGKPVE